MGFPVLKVQGLPKWLHRSQQGNSRVHRSLHRWHWSHATRASFAFSGGLDCLDGPEVSDIDSKAFNKISGDAVERNFRIFILLLLTL